MGGVLILGRRCRHNIEPIRIPNGRVTSQQGIMEELSRHFSMCNGYYMLMTMWITINRFFHSLTLSLR